MAKFGSDNTEKNNREVTIADFIGAFEDIAEANPELIEYIFTYYPPELMINYMSPEICQLLEQLKKSWSRQEHTDFYDFLSNLSPQPLPGN